MNPSGVQGDLLKDRTGIAIIESPFDEKRADAYILNANGTMRFFIKLPEKYRNSIFLGVNYEYENLTFHIVSFYGQYRFNCDENHGKIENFVEER